MASSDTHSPLRSFQHNVDDIRNLTMCKVCLRPFYEPFILICGHTFCYGCLRSWFCGDGGRRKQRNCPECRTVVKVLPAPNYALRDLAHMFTDRRELLPEDETITEHERGKTEEAKLLSSDRKGAGLFQGIFRRNDASFPLGAIRDTDDGVDRCPMCGWEIEDMGMCHRCGWHDADHDFSDQESAIGQGSEDDEDDEDMRYDIESDLEHAGRLMPEFYDIHSEADDTTAGTEGYGAPRLHDHNEDNADDMDDFITDDEDLPDEVDFDADDWNRRAAHRAFDVDADDHDEDDISEAEYENRSDATRRSFEEESHAIPSDDESNEGEDSDVQEVSRGNRFNRIISDDDEDEESEEGSLPMRHAAAASENFASGRSLLGTQTNTEVSDQHTVYDESDGESQPSHPQVHLPQTQLKRRRPIILSDDDDDDVVPERGPEWPASSDDSDDSIPPQPAARRMQRLNVHQAARARRSTPDIARSDSITTNATSARDRASRNGTSASSSHRTTSRAYGSSTRVH